MLTSASRNLGFEVGMLEPSGPAGNRLNTRSHPHLRLFVDDLINGRSARRSGRLA